MCTINCFGRKKTRKQRVNLFTKCTAARHHNHNSDCRDAISFPATCLRRLQSAIQPQSQTIPFKAFVAPPPKVKKITQSRANLPRIRGQGQPHTHKKKLFSTREFELGCSEHSGLGAACGDVCQRFGSHRIVERFRLSPKGGFVARETGSSGSPPGPPLTSAEPRRMARPRHAAPATRSSCALWGAWLCPRR